MPMNNTGRNALLTSGKGGITHIGALTDIATAEVAGGSYARQAITWQAAGTPAAGQAGNNGSIAIPIPAGATVQSLGLYDAASAGNLLGVQPYTGAGGTVKGVGTVVSIASDQIQSNGHGLVTDDRVFFSAVNGEALPTGLSATTLYFVRATGATVDLFTVATTSGGAAVDITGLGEVAFWKTIPNTFAIAGSLTLATNALLLDFTFA